MKRQALALLFLSGSCQVRNGTEGATDSHKSRPVNADDPTAAFIRSQEIVGPPASATAEVADESTREINYGMRAFRLKPFRTVAKVDLSDSQCGVYIEQQRIMTLGAGKTGAYTCMKLLGRKELKVIGGGRLLGLRYSASSPNTSFETAAALSRDPQGRWRLLPEATGTYDDLPTKSWTAFEKALR